MSNDVAESLDRLLNGGWDYHDKESERLARELEAAADKGVTPPYRLRTMWVA